MGFRCPTTFVFTLDQREHHLITFPDPEQGLAWDWNWSIPPQIGYLGPGVADRAATIAPGQSASYLPSLPSRDIQNLPVGTYEIRGTTYFPVALPQPMHHDQAMSRPVHQCLQQSYQSTEEPSSEPRLQSQGAPFRRSPVSSPHHRDQRMPDFSNTVQVAQMDSILTTNESEFPYRPRKNQQVGHARRISVAIKKTVSCKR